MLGVANLAFIRGDALWACELRQSESAEIGNRRFRCGRLEARVAGEIVAVAILRLRMAALRAGVLKL
jgi:hypothetical protein